MGTQAKIDYDQVVRKVVAGIGFDSYVDDLSSVDSKGLSDKTCEVLVRINKQRTSPTSSRSHSIADQAPSLCPWLCVSPSTKRPQRTATSAALRTPRTAASSSSGKTPRICPSSPKWI